MENTKIEWCDHTINFVTGCIHGCEYCYARAMAKRLGGMDKDTPYRKLSEEGFDPFEPSIHWDIMARWHDKLSSITNPSRIFITSMGDICCDILYHSVDEEIIPNKVPQKEVLERVMLFCEDFQRHTFLLLSKRPEAFRAFLWPRNVHIGTSIDGTNEESSERLRALYGVKAFTKWVSVEPLLDPTFRVHDLEVNGVRPDWVVIGGLSGKKPLPRGCDNSAERIILWCQFHGIPIFCKDNLPRLNMDAPTQYP